LYVPSGAAMRDDIRVFVLWFGTIHHHRRNIVKNRYALALVVLALVPAARAESPKVVELPKGIELVGLKTTVTSAAGGFILPGSKVDVIFKTNDPKTTVHLENLMVYAVDTGVAKEDLTISVGVTKTQREIVALLIRDEVKPQFVLRPPEKK
jgi:hypothetical protein